MEQQQNILLTLFQKFGKQYAKDSIIFFENEPGYDMYIIVAGKVEVLKEITKTEIVGKGKVDKKEYERIAILQPGDFFGEMSLLNDKPRSATIRALEPVKVIVLNKENFELILEKQPKLSVKILKTLSNRIRSLDKMLEESKLQQVVVTPSPSPQEVVPAEPIQEEPQETEYEEPAEQVAMQKSAGFDIKQWTNYWQSKIFLAAVELDIFNILSSEQLTAEELSKKINCDQEMTEILLDYLVEFGLLTKSDGTFSNSSDLNTAIETKVNFLDDLKFENQMFLKWGCLEDIIKSGLGKITYDYNVFRKMINQFSFNPSDALDALVSAVDLGSAKRMLEIGEMPAVYSIEVVKRLPKIIANVIDRSDSIQTTDEFVAQFQVGDKVNCQIGDYKNANFGKNYDIVIFAFGLRYRMEICKDIIARVKDALNADGYLIIHDMILKDNRLEPQTIASSVFQFLISSGAKIYTLAEVKNWLETSGFEITTGGILKDFSTMLIAKKLK